MGSGHLPGVSCRQMSCIFLRLHKPEMEDCTLAEDAAVNDGHIVFSVPLFSKQNFDGSAYKLVNGHLANKSQMVVTTKFQNTDEEKRKTERQLYLLILMVSDWIVISSNISPVNRVVKMENKRLQMQLHWQCSRTELACEINL